MFSIIKDIPQLVLTLYIKKHMIFQTNLTMIINLFLTVRQNTIKAASLNQPSSAGR